MPFGTQTSNTGDLQPLLILQQLRLFNINRSTSLFPFLHSVINNNSLIYLFFFVHAGVAWVSNSDCHHHEYSPYLRPSFRELHPSWGIVFPPKLTKLTLSDTCLPWEDMIHLSVLPNLEVLKLKNYAFTGSTWEPTEDSFCCLKYLFISGTNLQRWEADFCPFPRLQHLVLRYCIFLEEIPSGIGEAPLLKKIELHCCLRSAAASARNIQEEQQNYGNDFLTVCVTQGPNGKMSGGIQDEEDAPIYKCDDLSWTDVATTSSANGDSYTKNSSQNSGATDERIFTASTSKKSEGKMPMVEEETDFSYIMRKVKKKIVLRLMKLPLLLLLVAMLSMMMILTVTLMIVKLNSYFIC